VTRSRRATIRERTAWARWRAVKSSFGFFERLGVHVSPVHFYEPIPDTRTLDPSLFERRSELPGVDMNEAGQIALLDELARYRDGFARMPLAATAGPRRYHVDNPAFAGGDGDALYALLRNARPARVVEIGSGFSTLLIAETLRENGSGELIVIDPFPGDAVRGLMEPARLVAAPVQEAGLEVFAELGAGDVLFVDSSHVLRMGGDVQHLFLEVFPRLAQEVLVHVHDVFLPRDYPRALVVDKRFFWTEQYLLQAFLAFNGAFEVVLALAYLHDRHPERLEAAFAANRRDRYLPGSFWMRRRGA
jgi:predicted O-methyltransferase YrrM